jgi:3-hydroxypropionyl-CoA synthetase (ADP-forming)
MPKQLHEAYGFISPRSGLATNVAEARNLASEIGFPVVLKVVSSEIVHKTDVGGVQLNLRSEGQVEAAFQSIITSVTKRHPQAHLEGIMVEEMCVGGQEIIIGLLNDAQFGPSIMFGLGGIFVEVLKDVSFRVLPISEGDAAQMVGEIKGHQVLEGFRGLPPVSRDLLIELLLKASYMGTDLAPRLEAVDFNPILVWGTEHRVLDVKTLLHDQEKPVVENEPDTAHLEGFFEAKSVALLGASTTPGKIGNAVLDSLVQHEYGGKVYPINPSRDEVMGLKAYPSLSSVPEAVDLAVVTVALTLVPDILTECASKGIHNVVIVSGGGKELGGGREELEARIARLAKEKDLRIIGPNCIGTFDGVSRLDTFFQVYDRMVRPPRGPVSMLTQSGTVGIVFLEMAEELGMSKFVSYGNRVDVDESDLIGYLAQDPDTEVIACYIEGLADGRKLLNAAKEVTPEKPIVVFKGGQTERGARASVSHTGFFGGSYALFKGAMKQAGVVTVESTEELYSAAKALVMQPKAKGPRMAMISNGAGTMVQAIDLLEEYGLQLASIAPDTVAKLKEVYPPYYVVQNPVDVTGSASSEDYKHGIEALLQDPNVDVVMPWFVFQDTPLDEGIVDVLGQLHSTYHKPILCGGAGGPYTERMSRAVERVGVPVYATVREWMAAAKAVSA